MQKKSFMIAGLFLLVLIAATIFLSSNTFAVQTRGASSSFNLQHARQTYSRSPGLPALVSHLSTAAAQANGGATFTADDVRLYITTHPLPSGHYSFPAGTKIVVDKVAFLSNQEVTKLIGEPVGVPASQLLCYAEFHNVSGSSHTAAALVKMHEVFDTQTGNLLIFGGI